VNISDNNGVHVDDNGDHNGAASAQEKVRALLRRWQAQDNTPVVAAGPEPRPGETTTEALFRKWNEEDARMTDEEREAEDRLWREVEDGLAENRGLRLRRAGV
jgi:chromosome condensin MukBEF MukE localization factor